MENRPGKYQAWCVNNGIKIYPVPVGRFDYIIEVAKYRKKWHTKPGKIHYPIKPKHNEVKWYEVIEKLYEHYYKMANVPEYREKHKSKN